MRGAVLVDVADQHAFSLLRKLERFRQGRRNLLNCHTHPPAHDLPSLLEAIDDIERDATGNRKPDSLGSTRSRENRSVNSDQIPIHIDERSTRISWVNGRIGLNKVFIIGNPDITTPQGADDAERHGRAQTKGTPDG